MKVTYYRGRVDKQGRICLKKDVRDLLGTSAQEYVYVAVKPTGEFSPEGLPLYKEFEELSDSS
ncbi:unnamed protein product [marine sediment metagenome]|uniref:SpoVT-AbrB domain-containing protein n=2 Tax=marine sediment metagenome TaxID=412755 RepID=X1TEQ1_9ZZZZ